MAPLGFIPSALWLRQYPREWLRLDMTAGLTAAAVVIPKSLAYATIAGLPLQVGDILILCSDGVSNMVPDEKIAKYQAGAPEQLQVLADR